MIDETDNLQIDLVKKILCVIGENVEREGLRETPKRVVKSWRELYKGYQQDPKQILGTTFEADTYDQMIICKDIEIFSMCEHHMLPFYGKVHIAYIPNKKVVGLSKLARLAEVFARRLQIQERLTDQICNTLDDVLKPLGVMVVVDAKHMCMCSRGVNKQNSLMTTSSVCGLFKTDSKTRSEFLGLVNGK
jgi:GTP cyclohydrolase I